MAAIPAGQLACPHCGRLFRWKAGLAGRAVKCKCGGGFRIPEHPDGEAQPIGGGPPEGSADADIPARAAADHEQEPADDQTYALNVPDDDAPAPAEPAAPPPAAPANTNKCPNCNQTIKPGAVLCVKCGFNFTEGRKIQTEVAAADPAEADAPSPAPAGDTAAAGAGTGAGAGMVAAAAGHPSDPRSALAPSDMPVAGAKAVADEAKRQQIIDLYVPAGLIALGVFMHFVNSYYLGGDAAVGLMDAVARTVFRVVVWVPLAFLGMVLAVRVLDVAFGTLGMAIYKLIGIALGPGAVWSVISYLMPGTGWFIGFFVALGLYFGLLKMLFDLDGFEAFILIVIIIVLQLVAMFLGWTLLVMILTSVF